MDRREFLIKGIAVAGLVGLQNSLFAAQTMSHGMIYRTLGKTGEKVSAIG